MSIPIRKGYVETSGGQIHYRHAPGSGIPIVFFQQTASSSQMYVRVMERLAGEFAMFALDTPGFGGSFDPGAPPSMSDYTGWMVEAIDALGIATCRIFGHHTGACIGVELAAHHPARVGALLLAGPLPLTAAERDGFRAHFSAPFLPDAGGRYLIETWEYLRGLGADRDLALHHREMVDTLRACHGRSMAYNAVWDQDWTALYQQVCCPLLILCAEDDVLFPYFERARELRPDAQAAVVKGANFEPDLDAPGVAARIRQFLIGARQEAREPGRA